METLDSRSCVSQRRSSTVRSGLSRARRGSGFGGWGLARDAETVAARFRGMAWSGEGEVLDNWPTVSSSPEVREADDWIHLEEAALRRRGCGDGDLVETGVVFVGLAGEVMVARSTGWPE